MYPPGDDTPAEDISLGEKIEHKLMPGFTMEVNGIKGCETGPGRETPHMQYKITDPDGNADWLCAYDVRRA